MNWALEALELEPEADERAIKRAYARLLRDNRPDEHPEAFQRLHEAYQTALQWQRYQQELSQEDFAWEEVVGGDPMQTDAPSGKQLDEAAHDAHEKATAGLVIDIQLSHCGTPPPGDPQMQSSAPLKDVPAAEAEPHFQPVAASLQQHIDLEDLVTRVIHAAQSMPDATFSQWLDECPELWSISTKADAGFALFEQFNSQEPPVCGSNFDVIAATFHWQEIGSHIDTDTLAAMRGNLHVRWVVQAGNESQLALLLRVNMDGAVSLADARKCRELLVRPWHRLQALCSAWRPSRVQMMRATLQRLSWHKVELPSPPLNQQQLRFWRDLTDETRLTADRMLLGLVRGAVLSTPWLLLLGAVYVILSVDNLSAGHSLPSAGPLPAMAIAGVVITLLVGMGTLPWKLAWRQMMIPCLALGGIAIDQIQADMIGAIMAGSALWMAARLVLRKSSQMNQLAPVLGIGLFFAIPFVATALRTSYGQPIAVIALLLYLYNLWLSCRSRNR